MCTVSGAGNAGNARVQLQILSAVALHSPQHGQARQHVTEVVLFEEGCTKREALVAEEKAAQQQTVDRRETGRAVLSSQALDPMQAMLQTLHA